MSMAGNGEDDAMDVDLGQQNSETRSSTSYSREYHIKGAQGSNLKGSNCAGNIGGSNNTVNFTVNSGENSEDNQGGVLVKIKGDGSTQPLEFKEILNEGSISIEGKVGNDLYKTKVTVQEGKIVHHLSFDPIHHERSKFKKVVNIKRDGAPSFKEFLNKYSGDIVRAFASAMANDFGIKLSGIGEGCLKFEFLFDDEDKAQEITDKEDVVQERITEFLKKTGCENSENLKLKIEVTDNPDYDPDHDRSDQRSLDSQSSDEGIYSISEIELTSSSSKTAEWVSGGGSLSKADSSVYGKGASISSGEIECKLCREVQMKAISIFKTNYHTMDVDGGLFYESRTTEKREMLDKIMKIVTAFRNTCGGHLILHLKNQGDENQEDLPDITVFCETISYRIDNVIEDGQVTADAFNISPLPTSFGVSESKSSFLLINAEGNSSLTTVDYMSMMPTFEGIRKVKALEVARLLYMPTPTGFISSRLRGIDHGLQPNKDTTIKSCRFPIFKKPETPVDALCDYIWDEMRLKHYVTSMSKNKDGGSFYLGIDQEQTTERQGRTGRKITRVSRKLTGLRFHDKVQLLEHIRAKVLTNCLTLRASGFRSIPDDLVSVHAYPLEHDPSLYVLEVAIGHSDGVVLHGKPVAYKVENNKICLIDPDEWLARFERSYKHMVCPQH